MALAAAPRAVLAGFLLLAAPALAEERFDHKGALGLLVAGEFGGVDAIRFSPTADRAGRFNLDLGGTCAVGYDGNELLLLLSALFDTGGSGLTDLAVAGGYRGYFGRERFKTFFELDLSAHSKPFFTLGPRFGIGVQWEFTPIFGAYAALVGEIGLGGELRFSAQTVLGIQLRSYLLE